jgi:hypothetical protein
VPATNETVVALPARRAIPERGVTKCWFVP